MAEVNVNGSIDLNLNRGKRVNNNQRPRFKKDEHLSLIHIAADE